MPPPQRRQFPIETGRGTGPSGGGRLSPALVLISVALIGLVVALLFSEVVHGPAKPSKASATASPGGSPAPAAAPISDLDGYTLIDANGGADLSVVAFGSSRKTINGIRPAGSPQQPVRVGQDVVVVGSGSAYLLTPPWTGTPTRIGPADGIYPSTTPNTVWLWRQASGGASPTVELAGLPGASVTNTSTEFISGQRPIAELPAGTLVLAGGGTTGVLALWQPGSAGGPGTLVRSFGTTAGVVGWSGNNVAWLDASGCTSNGECHLHITDAATGKDFVIDPPAGYAGYLPGGSFSPASSSVFAAFVYNPVQHATAARLVFVTLAQVKPGTYVWTPALAPASDVSIGQKSPTPTAVWTPNGVHVLFGGDGGTLRDYHVGRQASAPTEQPVSSSYTVMTNPVVPTATATP